MIDQTILHAQKNIKRALVIAFVMFSLLVASFSFTSCSSKLFNSSIENLNETPTTPEAILKASLEQGKNVLKGDTVKISQTKPPMQHLIFLKEYTLHVQTQMQVDTTFINTLQAARIIDSIITANNATPRETERHVKSTHAREILRKEAELKRKEKAKNRRERRKSKRMQERERKLKRKRKMKR